MNTPRPRILTKANVIMAMFAVLASLLLCIGAFGRVSYDFYLYLRITVSGTALLMALSIEDSRYIKLKPLLFAAALLYNFVIPIHLSKQIWFPINLATIVLLLISIYPAMLPSNTRNDA